MLRRTGSLEDDEEGYWSNSKGCVGGELFGPGSGTQERALGELKALEKDLPAPASEASLAESGSETGSAAAIVVDEPVAPAALASPPSAASLLSPRTEPRPRTASNGSFATPPRAASASLASLSPQLARKAPGVSPSVCSGSSQGEADSASLAGRGGTPGSRREFSQADYARLESEYRKLRHKFAALRAERYQAPDVRESVQRLLKGQPALLAFYHGRKQKMELLKAALASGDGNVLTTVVLYLRETLSMPLFQEVLLKNGPAARHYAVHLREWEKWEELKTVLLWTGRREEAAMVDLRLALKHKHPTSKVTALRKAVEAGTSAEPGVVGDMRLVQDYVKLLEVQVPVEAADEESVRAGREGKWKVYPKAGSLVDRPVLTTLYYACLYHYDLPANSFASPLYLRQDQRLREKEFVWTAVRSLARQHRWAHIATLLTAPSLQLGGRFSLGPKKVRSPIPWRALLGAMARYEAPADVLGGFVADVADVEERLALATEFRCHKEAVDAFVATRDRQGLVDYNARRITQHTKESLYANGALMNSAIKWKN